MSDAAIEAVLPAGRAMPYATADTPGIGGAIKRRPEDFLVEELPLYEPSGSGEHVVVFLEKTQRDTAAVAGRLARAFGVSRRAVGYAGLKDRQAVARQHFTVHAPDADTERAGLRALEDEPGLTLLWVDRHGNKLRRGHLAGNRFVIRLRDVEPTQVVRAKSVLERLERDGVPNAFGPQRFGRRGDNARLGELLFTGSARAFVDELLGGPRAADDADTARARAAYDAGDLETAAAVWPGGGGPERRALNALRRGDGPGKAKRAIGRAHRELLESAFQAAVFNDVLARRLEHGSWDRLEPGDLAWKHDNGAVFAVDAPTAEAENGAGGRVPRLAVSPSGPIWGGRMPRAGERPGEIERTAILDRGLDPDTAFAPGQNPPGARRPLRVPVWEPDFSAGVDEHGGYLRLAFELPAGAFATAVIREIAKQQRPSEAG